jgi:NADH-quinone oxidoreductase subunit N
MMPASFTSVDQLAALPALLVALFGAATLLMDVMGRRSSAARRGTVAFSIIGLVFFAYALFEQSSALRLAGGAPLSALQDAVVIDPLALFANAIICGASLVLLLTSYRYLEIASEHRSEFYALVLFAQCGMYFMAAGADLVTLFVGMETTAVCFYILVGFTRANRLSNEASLKYLLLGAMASGFVLYGFSLLYGIAGSTRLSDIAAAVARRGAFDPIVILASVTATVGLLFKISAVPFHAWAPDAYDGAPTPVTGHLSVASSVAGFAVLLRILEWTLAAARPVWEPVVIVVAVASLTVGSVAAITQDRLKRFFAYSSIAHAGYILLGFVPNSEDGLKGIAMYLFVYALMNLGAFAVLTSLKRRGIAGDSIHDLAGLSKSQPTHAALFVVLLLSLAGLPPTAGFLAKYFIFVALLKSGHITLAVIAAAYVAVSLYFYFRLVREMYFVDGEPSEPLESSAGIRISLAATTVVTLFIGLFPEPLLRAGILIMGGPR